MPVGFPLVRRPTRLTHPELIMGKTAPGPPGWRIVVELMTPTCLKYPNRRFAWWRHLLLRERKTTSKWATLGVPPPPAYMALAMDRGLTPKKVANKLYRCYRICKCSFAVKYGTRKSGRISTENLFEGSNRDGSWGEVLAAMCELIGIRIIKSTGLSSRVYNPCARKIRNLFRPFTDIENVTKWDSEFSTSSSPVRSKRQLPTSVDTGEESFEEKSVTSKRSVEETFITEVSPHENSRALRGRIKNSSTECFFF